MIRRMSTNRSVVAVAFAAMSLLPLASLRAQLGASFDPNVDGYIEVPYSPQLVPQTGVTVEAWITYDETTVPTGWRYPTIVRQGLSAQGENLFLRMNCDQDALNNRRLRWRVRTSNGVNLTADYLFAPGEFTTWKHVAGTYDGAALNLYVDGVLVTSTPGNGLPIMQNNDVFRIGKGSDVATPIEVFSGEIDEVRLWPFARTAQDIQQTMNLRLDSVPGLVSTWNLDGDYTDSSSAMNGSVSGQVQWAANPLLLAPPVLPLSFPSGASTPGCLGDLRLCPTGPAVPDYLDYGVVCNQLPPGSLCLWAGTLATLPAPINVLGIDVWVDPTVLATVGGLADGLGSARLAFPLPSNAPVGWTFALQCIVLDPCGAQGFTASDAATIVIQ